MPLAGELHADSLLPSQDNLMGHFYEMRIHTYQDVEAEWPPSLHSRTPGDILDPYPYLSPYSVNIRILLAPLSKYGFSLSTSSLLCC